MKKPRVVFPFVEAGYGHIMPMRSIAETFQRKYGDKVEVVLSDFFTETRDKHLEHYEQTLSRQVRIYNRVPAIGYFVSLFGELLGSRFSSFIALRLIAPIAYKRAAAHMRDLAPDVVFSTHWATNYYAENLKNKPMTVMYCPDARFCKMFQYRSDLYMISTPKGYAKAIRKKGYNENNLKLVNFPIRNEAFASVSDKRAARKELGLPEDVFTVLLTEGGYGIGKMERICKKLIKERMPLTVIPVCGKNEKLYRLFSSLESTKEVTFKPYGFTDEILKLHAAADIFCGKSGNILAEATFFGVPTIVTNCTHLIERQIADHYINTVGCAVKQLSPPKTVKKIKEFAVDPSMLASYQKAALDYHERFGSEQAADELFKAISRLYPGLS